jgi:hypothetical protein
MREGSNEELIPAWLGAAKVRSQRSDHRIQNTSEEEKKRGGKVSKHGSLSMQGKATRVTEGQEVKEGSNVKKSKELKVTDLPVAI